MTAVNDVDIGRRHAIALGGTSDEGRRVVEWAVRNQSVTVEDQSTPPLCDGPFLYGGSVYRVSADVRNERPATRYFWGLTPVETADDAEIVTFADLPRLDCEKFRLVGLDDGTVTVDTPLDVGMTFVYANEDRTRSALVPTPERSVIEWESGPRALFSIRDSNSDGATLKTYRYTAERIAPSVEAHGRRLRDRYAFELAGLSDAERDLVDRATTEDGYTVERGTSPVDAFLSLVETFRRHEAVDGGDDGRGDDVSGEYLAAYDGQVYWTRLRRDDGSTGGKTATATATTEQ